MERLFSVFGFLFSVKKTKGWENGLLYHNSEEDSQRQVIILGSPMVVARRSR
jgi:hypothetical protein